jgi:hypothetical protein
VSDPRCHPREVAPGPYRRGSLTPHLVRTKVTARLDDEGARPSRKNELQLVFVVWSGLAESQRTARDVQLRRRVERKSYRSQDSPLNTAVKTPVCDFVRKEIVFALRSAVTMHRSLSGNSAAGAMQRSLLSPKGPIFTIDKRRVEAYRPRRSSWPSASVC